MPPKFFRLVRLTVLLLGNLSNSVIFRNGDNYIDWDELKEALIDCPAEPPVENWEIDEMFHEADKNGDGVIDVEGKYNR